MPPKPKQGRRLNWVEHLLKRPDTKIGSISTVKQNVWFFKDNRISYNEMDYNAGFERIITEIISNAIDNKWESDKIGVEMTSIKIVVIPETGRISVWNDGRWIPVEKQEWPFTDPKTQKVHIEKAYPAEIYFGEDLSGTNYDDDEDRMTSGRNGIGSKTTNIFSKYFQVVCTDGNHKFVQTFKDNLSIRTKPKIYRSTAKPYTEISFIPDYERFGFSLPLSEDWIGMIKRMAYETAMITGLRVSFSSDGKRAHVLPVKDLFSYSKLVLPKTKNRICITTKECQVVLAENQGYQQLSYVNGAFTKTGGAHVDAWKTKFLNQIRKAIIEKMTKEQQAIKISSKELEEHFMIMVNAKINKPEFESQSKNYLVRPKPKSSKLSESDLKKILKWDFVIYVKDMVNAKLNRKAGKTDGKKTGRVSLGAKYEPANWAGGKKSDQCALIITEGQSAMATAMIGRSVLKNGHNRYGVFAIRGKLINASTSTKTKLNENKEIVALKKILGASYGTDYSTTENFNTLRYQQGIYCMCDADVDGFHIRGLIMNAVHKLFPGLLERGFVKGIITPIVKVKTGKKNWLEFYTEAEYEKWREENSPNAKGDYYKGLAHFKREDAREYFKDMKLVSYSFEEESKSALELAFDKDMAHSRKRWISNYDPNPLIMSESGEMIEYSTPLGGSVCINSFVNHELIHYALETITRAIPSIYDGFKESQRKILYATIKKKIKTKMLVYQLAGYIAENANYHHGDASLIEAIIKMAQNYTGSNNINLLEPEGQFGTRMGKETKVVKGMPKITGGADHGHARYISTKLSKIARKIFRVEDDDVLEKVIDDGTELEPVHYMPIIPMILVNGANGMAMGYSTQIPQYNPLDLIEWISVWLDGSDKYPILLPWYRGFKGDIQIVGKSFMTEGIIEQKGMEYKITELPVGVWTNTAKIILEEKFLKEKLISNLRSYCTDIDVHFAFKAKKPINLKWLKNKMGMTNMIALDENGIPQKYDSVEAILEKFCIARLELYKVRKEDQIRKLEHARMVAGNKYRFIMEVIAEKSLVVFQRKEEELFEEMEMKRYDKVGDRYDYLVNMPFRSMTKKRLAQLKEEMKKLDHELLTLKQKSERELWVEELEELRKIL